jgi:hypothetical protein
MGAYDAETGELFEERPEHQSAEFNSAPRETLSQRATSNVKAPGYWDKREGIMKSTDNRWFAKDLLEAQKEIPVIFDADAWNPFTKSKYTSLGHLLSKIRPILHTHGFLLKQGAGKIYAHGVGTSKEPKYFLPVFMEIMHVDTGASERQMIEIPITKLDPQGVGICVTYGRRYLLQAYFGIASMDDDAASAVQKRLDKDEEAEAEKAISDKIKECATVEELRKWAHMNRDALAALSDNTVSKLRTLYDERLGELQDRPQEQATKKTKA